MSILEIDDPLPARPARVIVAGTSGSGKTTVAALVAARLRVPHVEIDGLFHGPGWVPRPSFEADVRAFTAGPGWVTEWQYTAVRDLLADRADLVIWLDLPRPVVMRQVIRRTLRRWARREKLWNGNVEPPLWTIFTNREHIVLWAWTTHRLNTERVTALAGHRPELPIVRLRSRAEVNRWLLTLKSEKQP
jgi:adenylate kinase family enzyme